MSSSTVRVGVDLGGTKVHSVVLGDDHQVLAEDTRLSGFGADEVVKNLKDSISEALSTLHDYTIGRIGIGTPGTVDSDAGIVRHSLNLGIESLLLRQAMEDIFHCQVQLENDVNATALGLAAIAPEHNSLCYLNFGTGLAAGLVINGKVWSGASGLAGEIGHIPLASRLHECACGQKGCLELFTSWSGLRKALPGHHNLVSVLDSTVTDAEAARVWADFIQNAVLSIETIFLTWDPEVIFIGGGLVASLQRPFDEILEGVRALEESAPLFAQKRISQRVLPMPKGLPVAAMGALFG